MFKKIDNEAAKKFVIVYAVCWILSGITCAIMYFKWFSEARALQRRANRIIERDIIKEVFDDISNRPSRSSGKWDFPDVDEDFFTSASKPHGFDELDEKLSNYMPAGDEWDKDDELE